MVRVLAVSESIRNGSLVAKNRFRDSPTGCPITKAIFNMYVYPSSCTARRYLRFVCGGRLRIVLEFLSIFTSPRNIVALSTMSPTSYSVRNHSGVHYFWCSESITVRISAEVMKNERRSASVPLLLSPQYQRNAMACSNLPALTQDLLRKVQKPQREMDLEDEVFGKFSK